MASYQDCKPAGMLADIGVNPMLRDFWKGVVKSVGGELRANDPYRTRAAVRAANSGIRATGQTDIAAENVYRGRPNLPEYVCRAFRNPGRSRGRGFFRFLSRDALEPVHGGRNAHNQGRRSGVATGPVVSRRITRAGVRAFAENIAHRAGAGRWRAGEDEYAAFARTARTGAAAREERSARRSRRWRACRRRTC